MKKILATLTIIIILTSLGIYHKHHRDQKITLSPKLPSNNSAILIIHLDRAIIRQENVNKIFSSANEIDSLKSFQQHIIESVDGKQLSDEDRQKYYKQGIFTPHPVLKDNINLSNNLIACFLSHRKAWQYIVDNNLDSGLIFEDDVKIEPHIFNEAIKIGLNNLREDLLIRFRNQKLNKIDQLLDLYNEGIYIRYIPPTCLASYLISKQTAKKLLDLTKEFDRPVDEYLKLTKITGVYSAEVYPTGITEISEQLGGSNIGYQEKKVNFSFFDKIILEFKRAFYRLQLLHL